MNSQINNKKITYDFIHAMNQCNEDIFDMIDNVFLNNAVISTSLGKALGSGGFKTHVRDWRYMFQGRQAADIINQVVEDMFVTVHFVQKSEHIGTFKSVEATGNIVDYRAMALS